MSLPRSLLLLALCALAFSLRTRQCIFPGGRSSLLSRPALVSPERELVMDAPVDTYLTDGLRLFRVEYADSQTGEVWLEDCSCPNLPYVSHTIKQLVEDGFQAVRPDPALLA